MKKKPSPRPVEPQPFRPVPFDPPDFALPCWLEAKNGAQILCIGVPSKTTQSGHTLRVPLSDPSRAIALLTKVLTDRQNAATYARIGEPGVPLQSMLDALSRDLASIKPFRRELRAQDLDDLDFS